MINIDKIKTIISFLAENVSDLYITKLMKLFYYIDFISYAERGSSVTNDIYYKLPYGPVPSFIKNEIDILTLPKDFFEGAKGQLSDFIALEEKRSGKARGYVIKNKKEVGKLNNLSTYEIELLKRVVSKFKNSTSKELTEKTHSEAPYLYTSENAVIDYNLALQLDTSEIL